jgi:hypothetical protein
MYFCLSCVVVGGSGAAFYKLMQPILNPSRDVSAYSAAPLPAFQKDERAVEKSSAPEPRAGNEAAFASAIEPEGEPRNAQDTSKPTKVDAAPLSSHTKPKRPAHPKRHDPMMDYAVQPAFGDYYRQWNSHQAWNGYRPSGNYQASGSYGSWNSDRGWGVPGTSQDSRHRSPNSERR